MPNTSQWPTYIRAYLTVDIVWKRIYLESMRVSVVKEIISILRNCWLFTGFSLCVPDACLHLRGSEGRSKGRYEKGRTQWRSRRLLKKRWKQPCSWNGHGHGRGRIWQEGLRWPLLSQVNLSFDLYCNSGSIRYLVTDQRSGLTTLERSSTF